MAVLMVNAELGVRDAGQAEDAGGYRSPGVLGDLRGPWPGRTRQRADGTWSLALDPAAWPLGADDVVVEVVGGAPARTWTVGTAERRVNAEAPDADFVQVDALLRGVTDDAGSTP